MENTLDYEKLYHLYNKMYSVLCGSMDKALNELPETPENAWGRLTMKKALLEAEELYITADV